MNLSAMLVKPQPFYIFLTGWVPGSAKRISPSTTALEDWLLLGSRAPYRLPSRRQRKKTRSLPGKQFTDSSVRPAFNQFPIYIAADNYLCVHVSDPHPYSWVMMDSLNYYSPFTTAWGSWSGRTCHWSPSSGLQSQREKSMSLHLAAVLSTRTGWDPMRPLWPAW